MSDDTRQLADLQQQLAVLTQRYDAAQREAARNAAITHISRLITSSLSLREIFQTAVESICEHLHFAYLAAGVVDPEDAEQLMLIAQAGAYAHNVPDDYRQSIHEGIVGAAARTRQYVLVNDLADDQRYLSLLGPTICAELAMPIVRGARLLGVLNVESAHPLDAGDIAGIALVADQLAIAMDNADLFARTQQTLAETQLLYRTSERISTAAIVDDVVKAYLEQVAQRRRYVCTIVLYELGAAGQRVAVVVRGFWSPQTGPRVLNEHIPHARDALDVLLDAGQTVTIADVDADTRASDELRAMQQRDGRPALALIPLMVRGQRIGLVVLSYGHAYAWPEAELRPYQVTAAQLATAIDSRRQQFLVNEQGQHVAVLEERRRLARELHDSVTQSLFSMSLLSQVVPDLWELDQDEARGALAQIRELTRGALAEMRALLFELRPAVLEEQGLGRALHHHVALFEQRTGTSVALTLAALPELPPAVEQALFRIAQEALTNIARHAEARHVRLVLQAGTPLRLCIADDGRGFDPQQVGEGHFGLLSIRERATMIGAKLVLGSAVGQGTEIVVEWPDRASDAHD